MLKIKPAVKKMIALAAAVSLGASLTACAVETEASSQVSAQEGSSSEDILTKTARELLKTTTKSDENGKEETVYVIQDADGNNDSVIVSNWLKNGDGKDELVDKTNLTDIENTKGDETYTENSDGTITWDAHGDDIFYKGTSNEELPVNVNIKYKLDGKTVSAQELEGASGHLEVEFSYENRLSKTVDINGEKTTLNKPCAVVSGLLMDGKKSSNVKVTNGKVVNDGDRSVVVGLALPGMKENLDLSDLDEEEGDKINDIIPDTVTVEADVTDFSMIGTVSLASYDLPIETDLDKYSSDIDGMKDSAAELQDGADKLVDGAKELSDYMKELKDGTDTLSEGTGKLASGADTLSGGAEELSKGTGTLSSGADSLSEGAGQLAGGLDLLSTSVAQLPDGADKLYQGSLKLAAALKSGDSSSVDKYGVYEAVSAMESGAEDLKSVLGLIMNGAQSLYDNALTMADGAKSGSTDPKQFGIYEAAGALKASLDQKVENLETNIGTAVQTLESANGYGQSAVDAVNALIESGTLNEEQASAILENIQGEMQTVSGAKQALAAVNADTTQADAIITQIQDGADALNQGAQDIATGAKSNSTEPSKYGLYEAAAAAYAGADKLSQSASELVSKIDYMAGSENMGALTEGLKELNSQSDQLIDAVGQLSGGANTLNGGAKSLADGAGTLNSGAAAVAGGAKELASGIKTADSGAKTLAEGAAQLLEGTNTLSDGINTLNEDGISKIAELMGDKVGEFYDRLKAIADYANEKTDFAGVAADTECKVQYIFKTGEVADPSEDSDN